MLIISTNLLLVQNYQHITASSYAYALVKTSLKSLLQQANHLDTACTSLLVHAVTVTCLRRPHKHAFYINYALERRFTWAFTKCKMYTKLHLQLGWQIFGVGHSSATYAISQLNYLNVDVDVLKTILSRFVYRPGILQAQFRELRLASCYTKLISS